MIETVEVIADSWPSGMFAWGASHRDADGVVRVLVASVDGVIVIPEFEGVKLNRGQIEKQAREATTVKDKKR